MSFLQISEISILFKLFLRLDSNYQMTVIFSGLDIQIKVHHEILERIQECASNVFSTLTQLIIIFRNKNDSIIDFPCYLKNKILDTLYAFDVKVGISTNDDNFMTSMQIFVSMLKPSTYFQFIYWLSAWNKKTTRIMILQFKFWLSCLGFDLILFVRQNGLFLVL